MLFKFGSGFSQIGLNSIRVRLSSLSPNGTYLMSACNFVWEMVNICMENDIEYQGELKQKPYIRVLVNSMICLRAKP